MILVVSPNLTVDAVLSIDRFTVGEVHRTTAHRRAGGKGVNFARASRSLGEPALILGFAGGTSGEHITRGLADEGLASEVVRCDGESRTCTIVLESSGRASVVNETGPTLDAGAESTILERYRSLLPRARAAAFMGSLQPGLRDTFYRECIELARRAEVPTLVDTSGPSLRHALEARPWIAKPNRRETEELLGSDLSTGSARIGAASAVREMGARVAVISFGSEGVVAASDAHVAKAETPPTDTRLGNPIGSGDALAAGLMAGVLRGFPTPDVVRLGVAAAVASLVEGFGRLRAKDVRTEAVTYTVIADR